MERRQEKLAKLPGDVIFINVLPVFQELLEDVVITPFFSLFNERLLGFKKNTLYCMSCYLSFFLSYVFVELIDSVCNTIAVHIRKTSSSSHKKK